MYIGPIEAAVEAPQKTREAKGGLLLGLALLLIGIPWLAVCLIAHFIVKDVRLLARAARAVAQEYRAVRAQGSSKA